MRVRVYRLVSNVLFGLSEALVWLAVPPRSPMITTLGLPGPSAAEGRLCRAALRRSSLGRVPTGEVMCRANFDPARPGFRASVFYDTLSRRVTSAHAAFGKLDSLAVVALADSITRALDARGGQRVQCAPVHPAVVDLHADELWRSSGFDVRLLSHRPLPYQGTVDRQGWYVALHALPTSAADCSCVRRLHN